MSKFLDSTGLSDLLTRIKGAFVAKSDTVEAQSLGIDSAPTANSTNLVTSGGVKSYVDNNVPAAQIQSDWNQIDTDAKDYIKNKPSIPAGVVVDQTYDSTSQNAQSGVAMSGALATKQDNMVVLTYGTSTWSDFIVAYNKNAVVYCYVANGNAGRLAFMAYKESASVEFQYYRSVNGHTATQQGDQVIIYKLTSSSAWTTTTREAMIWTQAGNGLQRAVSGNDMTYSVKTPSNSGLTVNSNGVAVTKPVPSPASGDNGKILGVIDTNGTIDWVTKPSSSEDFVVSIDVNFTTSTTYQQIADAYLAGKRLIAEIVYVNVGSTVMIHKTVLTTVYNDSGTYSFYSLFSVTDSVVSSATALSVAELKIVKSGTGLACTFTQPDSTPTASSGKLVTSGGVKTYVDSAVSGKEVTTNKVTSLSSSSTDDQYPSAKCVYDMVGDIETLLAAI